MKTINKPRDFIPSDVDYVSTLITRMVAQFPGIGKGFEFDRIEAGGDQMDVGNTFIVNSVMEECPSILPRAEWRHQQAYTVTAMWEVYCPHTGSDVSEKTIGTFKSLSDAVVAIVQEVIQIDLMNICEGTDYPLTTTPEEV